MFALVKKLLVDIVWHIAPPEFKLEDGSEYTLCQERFIPAETEVMTRWRLAALKEKGFQFCETCMDEYKTALPALRAKGRALY